MSPVEPDLQRVFERAEPGARKAHKRQVMACALAVFERDGLESATIDAIRSAAGSSIGSIYHHFGHKDGLIASLFFAALDDQAALVEPRIATAGTPREAVVACIGAYLDWVSLQPRLARFMYRARSLVAAGPGGAELEERNRRKFQVLRHWLRRGIEDGSILELPKETYVPLLIGPSESYCRAWLAERVKARPSEHLEVFGQAAWRSIAA